MSKKNNNSAPYRAEDIAKYFIYLANQEPIDEEENRKIYESITNLKLQKILYFAQAYHAVKTGKPLFEEDIEAWMYGPVVPVVYRKYKSNGAGPIPLKEKTILLPEETKKLMNDVWEIFGKHSARKLVDITHVQKPYQDAYEKGQGVIEVSVLKEYYRSDFLDR